MPLLNEIKDKESKKTSGSVQALTDTKTRDNTEKDYYDSKWLKERFSTEEINLLKKEFGITSDSALRKKVESMSDYDLDVLLNRLKNPGTNAYPGYEEPAKQPSTNHTTTPSSTPTISKEQEFENTFRYNKSLKGITDADFDLLEESVGGKETEAKKMVINLPTHILIDIIQRQKRNESDSNLKKRVKILLRNPRFVEYIIYLSTNLSASGPKLSSVQLSMLKRNPVEFIENFFESFKSIFEWIANAWEDFLSWFDFGTGMAEAPTELEKFKDVSWNITGENINNSKINIRNMKNMLNMGKSDKEARNIDLKKVAIGKECEAKEYRQNCLADAKMGLEDPLSSVGYTLGYIRLTSNISKMGLDTGITVFQSATAPIDLADAYAKAYDIFKTKAGVNDDIKWISGYDGVF